MNQYLKWLFLVFYLNLLSPDVLAKNTTAKVSLYAGTWMACALVSGKVQSCIGDPELTQLIGTNDTRVLAIGTAQACAINQVGEINCYGKAKEMIGKIPTRLEQRAVHLEMSETQICAIDDAHQLFCWGDVMQPPPFALTQEVKQVALGLSHACILTLNDLVGCWGGNHFQQLELPVHLKQKVKQIAVGNDHTCLLQQDQRLYCFGKQNHQQTNIPDQWRQEIVQVQAAGEQTCALRKDQSLRCWGGFFKQSEVMRAGVSQFVLGNHILCLMNQAQKISCMQFGSLEQTQPEVMANLRVEKAYAANQYSCFLPKYDLIAGAIQCWGQYLPDAYDKHKTTPVVATQVALGIDSICWLDGEYQTRCDGNVKLAKEHPIATDDCQPSALSTCQIHALRLQAAKKIVTGGKHYCVYVENQSSAYCWGENSFAQSQIPAALKSQKIAKLSMGLFHTCAITKTQFIHCWGDNYYGQIQPDKTQSILFYQMASGNYHNCAIDITRRLQCWGDNRFGQTQIPSMMQHDIKKVFAGYNQTCATSMTDQLACWGANRMGQLNIPPGWDIQIKSISLGRYHTCATKKSGEFNCWGDVDFLLSRLPSNPKIKLDQPLINTNFNTH